MYDVIINPTAGGKKTKKTAIALEVVKAHLTAKGLPFSVYFTTKQGEAKTITEEVIKNGATDIIVIGGDGTLHEVINGFSNFDKVNLGIIPSGTGNDFASALNLPENPEKAIEIITETQPKYADFMQMPTVRGLNVIGMGIDVDVLRRYSKLKKKTKLGYTMSLIKTLFNFDFVDFDVEINGKRQKERSFIACIANGNRYGGGIPICPIANPTDAKLDFLTVSEIKGLKIIPAFLKLKAGKILKLKQSKHQNMQEVKIIPNGDYTVNVDGELYDNIPFEVKIVSNTLKVYYN